MSARLCMAEPPPQTNYLMSCKGWFGVWGVALGGREWKGEHRYRESTEVCEW